MRVGIVMATKGRHSLLERALGCFLKQNYKGEIFILIYNNSRVEQQLDKFDIPKNIQIAVVNQYISFETGEPYSCCGQIYRDALTYIPEDVSLLNFADDDDIFLPDHIPSKKIELAYKPYYSFFMTPSGIQLAHNMHEPSIFVKKSHVLKYGFYDGVDYHHKWIEPLGRFEDKDGPPTFVYCWMGNNHQISGDPNNPNNFKNHEEYLKDEGDGIITPQDVTQLYNELKDSINTAGGLLLL